jgi:large subunit ribosomal protein L1
MVKTSDEKAKKVTEKKSKKAKNEKAVIKAKEVKSGSVQKNNQDTHPSTSGRGPQEGSTKELTSPTQLAKAGKRSAKAVKEAEQKQAKEEKKASQAESDQPKPKTVHQPPRSRLERRSKKYKEVYKLIDPKKSYSLSEAAQLAAKTSTTKFDATVELHVRLGVDPKQSDQNIRGMVSLPAGTGKSLTIAVFADPSQLEAAKKAGAAIVGGDEFLQQLDKGELNFDILISTPGNMPKLGKYAKLLGPKGLMPNPKSGTVAEDVSKAVKEASSGRTEYRVDPNGIAHVAIGKVSFGADKIKQNLEAVVGALKANKPSSLKGIYILSAYVSTSMGPSIALDTASL